MQIRIRQTFYNGTKSQFCNAHQDHSFYLYRTWAESILVSNWVELLAVVPIQHKPAIQPEASFKLLFFGPVTPLKDLSPNCRKETNHRTQFVPKTAIHINYQKTLQHDFTSFRTSAAESLARENKP
jgi:hypothetical protein